MAYLHENVKLRVGGRKAPKISISEFKRILTDQYEKIKADQKKKNYGWDEECEDVDSNPIWIFYTDRPRKKLEKLDKDIKVEVDFENVNLDEISITSSGIPYASFFGRW